MVSPVHVLHDKVTAGVSCSFFELLMVRKHARAAP